MPNHETQSVPKHVTQPAEVLENIVKALDGLRFGSVEIIVHEGRVTFIERKEKLRL